MRVGRRGCAARAAGRTLKSVAEASKRGFPRTSAMCCSRAEYGPPRVTADRCARVSVGLRRQRDQLEVRTVHAVKRDPDASLEPKAGAVVHVPIFHLFGGAECRGCWKERCKQLLGLCVPAPGTPQCPRIGSKAGRRACRWRPLRFTSRGWQEQGCLKSTSFLLTCEDSPNLLLYGHLDHGDAVTAELADAFSLLSFAPREQHNSATQVPLNQPQTAQRRRL